MMLHSWRISSALTGIFVCLVVKNAFAIENLPEILEYYPESHDQTDKVANNKPYGFEIFSEGEEDRQMNDGRRNHMELADKMAFEPQKRTAKLVNTLPKNIFLANWEANSRRYRRPFVRKSISGRNYKVSFPPGKRPYYYSEPEGSEFLGGPGK
ncbi:hypothetical protein JTE90_025704 [Oedothorax gibbosus]|uniref:Uncharacterized protein n=1 Tax=Oedothorax gibbosus TaxID=931172 RepID=A0AAV6UI08_9ARAC|nr:hypothetical protein JTE90_025704 [Oedothorax gibbosus]